MVEETFLDSWGQYSQATVNYAEATKTKSRELKHALREDYLFRVYNYIILRMRMTNLLSTCHKDIMLVIVTMMLSKGGDTSSCNLTLSIKENLGHVDGRTRNKQVTKSTWSCPTFILFCPRIQNT